MNFKKKENTFSSKLNSYFNSYDPKDHGTKYYKSSDFEKYIKMTPLEKIDDIRNRIRNPYMNQPTMGEIEKVLTHAIAEISNLQKRNSELEQRVDELLKENDEISNSLAQEFYDTKDNIEIHFSDEVVTIDGELATQVVNQAVTQFIIEALNQAANKD